MQHVGEHLGHRLTTSNGNEKSLSRKLFNRARAKDPKYLKAVKDCETALEVVSKLLKKHAPSGYALSSWLEHFDCNHDMVISFEEFMEGMTRLEYHGSAQNLFKRIDIDGSGELTLDEIDPDASKLWIRFRFWSVQQFESPGHMIRGLSTSGSGHIVLEDFKEALDKFGWDGGCEEVIFSCICNDVQCVTPAYLNWFEKDKAKALRKMKARKEAIREQAYHARERGLVVLELKKFKAYLKKKYHTFLRAWRCALDLDGSMSIQKSELFTAVKEMNWHGNVRLVWKGLDRDMSGITSLLELDLKSAYQLARFKEFCTEKFGSVTEAFQAFDTKKKFKLSREEFLEGCQHHGFQKATPGLFHGLDWKGEKYIMKSDLVFLDSWRCPLYLICKANEQAAREFKDCLIRMYKNYIKAWRHCLDRDNSNCVAWEEFEAAARKIRFTGDLPGAWRFLDKDFSGSISLYEIDPESSDALLGFKRWTDEEFGGIRSAFSVIDTDGTLSLNRREFRKAMTSYGYQGDVKRLFEALDVDGQGVLTLNEVMFLQDWETEPISEEELKEEEEHKRAEKMKMTTSVPCPPRILEIAQPKNKLPRHAGSICTGKSRPDRESSYFLKPKVKKSPYLASPVLSAFTPSLPVSPRMAEMKDEILRLPIIEVEPACSNRVDFSGNLGWNQDMASLRSNTNALRNRTRKLLSRIDDCDRQMSEDVALWSAVPAPHSPSKPTSTSKVCKLPALF